MAHRIITDPSTPKMLIGVGQSRPYPYQYPFFYSDEAMARHIDDHSSNIRTH